MASPRRTHYDVLGIPPGAKHTEVGLAFNRKMAAMRREDAPPDPNGEARLREAFAVLSDLDRRAEYDADLRRAALEPAFGRNHVAIAALFLVLVAVGLFWYLRPQLAPESVALEATGPGKPRAEILGAAIPAIGRLQVMEMSGVARPAGIAFAVDEGVAVTSCQGLSPTSQLTVILASRAVPARVTMSNDELGLCKLEVRGAGSWPLAVSTQPARQGDMVYTTQVGATGDVAIREATVRSVTPRGKASILEVSVPLMAQHAGSPLFDIHGRVVAVANMPAGEKETFVAIPPSWADVPKEATAPSAEPADDDPATPATPGSQPGKPGEIDELGVPLETRRKQEELARKIDPARKERLEKAFRPPPTVPDDI